MIRNLFRVIGRLFWAAVDTTVDEHYNTLPDWIHDSARPTPSSVPGVSRW